MTQPVTPRTPPTNGQVVNVLVIEAGPLDQGEDSVLIPGAFPPFQYWTLDLLCQPQVELNNRSAPAISGRVVGGGSAVNAMVFLRSESARSNKGFMLANHVAQAICENTTTGKSWELPGGTGTVYSHSSRRSNSPHVPNIALKAKSP